MLSSFSFSVIGPRSKDPTRKLLLHTQVLFQDIDWYLRIQKATLYVLVATVANHINFQQRMRTFISGPIKKTFYSGSTEKPKRHVPEDVLASTRSEDEEPKVKQKDSPLDMFLPLEL